MFDFIATADFRTELDTFEKKVQKLIIKKIAYFSGLEDPILYSKKLMGHKGLYRFRVEDYRILFRLSGRMILLTNVGHRKDVYQGLL